MPVLRIVQIGLVLAVATGCVAPPPPSAPVDGRKGIVLGSVVVELARTRRSDWDGFFEADLALRKPSFLLRVAKPAAGQGAAPAPVEFKGREPVPFVLSLAAGRQAIDGLELQLYRGALGWSLGLISPADGKRFDFDLAFDVDPDVITYIGRIHIVLPRKVQFFSSQSRVRVTDSYDADRADFLALIENTPLTVRTALARSGVD